MAAGSAGTAIRLVAVVGTATASGARASIINRARFTPHHRTYAAAGAFIKFAISLVIAGGFVRSDVILASAT